MSSTWVDIFGGFISGFMLTHTAVAANDGLLGTAGDHLNAIDLKTKKVTGVQGTLA